MINAPAEVETPEFASDSGETFSPIEKTSKIKNQIKTVRIIARLNVGGPARHVVWLTRALQDAEYQSVLLAGTVPEGEKDMSYFAAENGVAPIFIEEMSRELSLQDLISLWKIYRQLRREKPDIIHTHTAKAGTVGRVAGFLYRWLGWNDVVIVHTFHGHIFHSYYGGLKTKIFLLIEKILARLATDKIIVISRKQFEEIHRDFGVGREKQFQIIPLGIDLEAFGGGGERRKILRETVGAADDEIIVGIVGRLTEVKNHLLYLRVVKHWQENSSLPKIKFVIIGDGNLREALEAEAAALGVRDAAIFLGNRDDTNVLYAGLDIVALTSLNEGTPLSLIEAMASERAVISTKVGGVVDLLGEVEERKNGFEIRERGIAAASDDEKGFLEGLRYLVENAAERERFGRGGKKFVEENYGKSRLVNDIKNLYRVLTGN